MADNIFLCYLSDIPQKGILKIQHPLKADMSLVVIQKNQKYYAYHNICPHFSIQLDNATGQFFTYENQWLMCAHHSAMFEITTGQCVDGPCKDRFLTQASIEIVDKKIFLKNCLKNTNS